MKTSFLILTLIFASHALAAGGISGGGGKGVVCRNPDLSIRSAQTLDLYEGRAVYGFAIAPSTAPMQDQISKALAVIPEASRRLVETYVKNVEQGMQVIAGVELEPVEDALVIATPRGCQAEQLANYFNDQRILINGDIWSKLSETDRAALILHEAIYATERLFGAKNSQRTRHVVASLFEPQTPWTDLRQGLPATKLNCVAGRNIFWAFEAAPGAWRLQFQTLGLAQVMSQKIFDLSIGEDFNLNEANTFPVVGGEDKIGSGDTTVGRTVSAFENGDIISFSKKWERITNSQSQMLKGVQTPRYYMSWTSGTYPDSSTPEELVNCSVVIP